MKYETIDADQFKDLMEQDIPRYVVWDIETAPLPKSDLLPFLDKKKIKYPEEPGIFNPMAVRYGNIADPAKKQKRLATARTNHHKKVQLYTGECHDTERRALDELYDKAALYSHTNCIVAIGYGVLQADGSIATFLNFDGEEDLVRRCWYMIGRCRETHGQFFTHNGVSFDIPQIVHKAWKYDIPFQKLRTKYNKLVDTSVDIALEWQHGVYRGMVKLDYMAKMLGVGHKLEGVTGDMFHKLLDAGKFELAQEYLYLDIDCTYKVAVKLGLLDTPINILRQYAKQEAT